MAGASRLLRTSRALQSDNLPSSSSSSSASCCFPSLKFHWGGGEKRTSPSCQGRKRVAVSLDDTAVVSPEKKRKSSVADQSLAAKLARTALELLGPLHPAVKRIRWATQAEMLIEKGVIGCQSFTLIAVAGSLIGSVLCFVVGCFFVLESFFQYFHTLSQRGDQGGIIRLLVEAIDMFLVGTALLTFGMGLYVMFVGSDEMKRQPGWQAAGSDFGSFDVKKLAECLEMQSISQAKSKLGHAILLVLQAGVLDKFKNVPLVSGLDLACVAGAVFISSASVFLLSKLTTQ